MATKLWQKNYTLDLLMERFTVRNDYILDMDLVLSDIIGSAAHMRGLGKIGILASDEVAVLDEGLRRIATLRKEGDFQIKPSDEDCHTAIEGFLTEHYGEVGKKIHTGRSRNDQVQTAIRIFLREAVLRLSDSICLLVSSMIGFSRKHALVPMPGRTHMQKAMPSSVALWMMSYAEELVDELGMAENLYGVFDQSPLGSAASYGTTLPLDREYTASLMGFSKVQNNVLYANNSRGKFELFFLDWCSYIALTLSKLSQDLMLFTLPEFSYFSLPAELCTGSSIMPQKKNPDGLELARSRTSLITSLADRVRGIIKSLPSGYNRDFQDTKEPLVEGYRATEELVMIFRRMIDGLEVDEEALKKACTSELYATDRVMEKVLGGGNFRDSYRQVGLNLSSVEAEDPVASLSKRTSTGTAGNLRLDVAEDALEAVETFLGQKHGILKEVYSSLAGIDEVIL